MSQSQVKYTGVYHSKSTATATCTANTRQWNTHTYKANQHTHTKEQQTNTTTTNSNTTHKHSKQQHTSTKQNTFKEHNSHRTINANSSHKQSNSNAQSSITIKHISTIKSTQHKNTHMAATQMQHIYTIQRKRNAAAKEHQYQCNATANQIHPTANQHQLKTTNT